MTDTVFVESENALLRLKNLQLQIHPQQCVRLRHRKARCMLCTDHCPTGAIVWYETARVDPGKCIQCGICAAVCPTGAIEAAGPTNLELLGQISALANETSTITFICRRVTGSNRLGVIGVPCLGRLDTSVLVGAAAVGIRKVELVGTECGGCGNQKGNQVAARSVDEANHILQACGGEPITVFTDLRGGLDQPEIPAASLPVATTAAFPAAAGSATPLHAKGELPIYSPIKNQILLSSLQAIAPPGLKAELQTGLWAAVSIDQSCTGCQMCAFFCPTGALLKSPGEGKPALTFKDADCTGCRLCQEICYTSSVKISNLVSLEKICLQTSEIIWSDTQTSSHQEKMRRLRMFRQ
jgi:Pyruvate/2-oxoacid:ferredoxin oxidoreductase delta subunit